MSNKSHNYLFTLLISRLTATEKQVLIAEMEIASSTLYYWKDNPDKVRPANKKYLTEFINEILGTTHRTEDLFELQATQS